MLRIAFFLLFVISVIPLPAIGTGTIDTPKLHDPSSLPVFVDCDELPHVTPADVDRIFSLYSLPGSPGCAVGVMFREHLIFANGYGMANLDYDLPIRPDSRFLIASVSKQFAAAALLMLEQEGKIDLDADIRKYIPELPRYQPAITPRQLIHHTSGLRDLYNLLNLADIGLDNTTTTDDAIELLSRQRQLNFPAGSAHIYSNSGYLLISVLIERITGMTLDAYSQKHLFEPSGMKHTHWHDDTGRIVPNRVISYRPMPFGSGRFYRDNMDRVGARGLFTTLFDFHLWHSNFIHNKTHLNDFNRKMTEPGRLPGRTLAYASGLRTGRYKTLHTVGHSGSYMGFVSDYIHIPSQQFAVAVFCNQSNFTPAALSRKVADLYLAPVFDDIFKPYEGVYTHTASGTQYQILTKQGDLFLVHDETELKKRLRWHQNDQFESDAWSLRFYRHSGAVNRFTIQSDQAGVLTFYLNES
ncbi:serine hydrolase domain-containing protein [Balneolaceae bacterium ANBcel3]|nr:serine hydrolase domain-containing protein [Balneolaceae bacterium ANBcel3]